MAEMKIVWRREDGGVTISTPGSPRREGETDANYLERVARRRMAARRLSPDTEYQMMEARSLPPARLRNAWKWAPRQLTVDLVLARQVLVDEVRWQRNVLLDQSDKEQARLNDVGTAAEKLALAEYRQGLRDLPALVSEELALVSDLVSLAGYEAPWPVKEFSRG